MSSITVHIIDDDGLFVCSRSGDIGSVMLAVDIEKTDFTMTTPPDFFGGWRWIDNEWIADDTAE